MDPIQAVHATLITQARIPLEFYRQFYKGCDGGFGPWVWRVNREICAQYGIKLRKRGNAYVPLNPTQQLRSGDQHGRKAIRQKDYQIETYDALMQRSDAPEETKILAVGKRDKAASSLSDMRTKQRLRERVTKLLEGK